MKGKLIIMMGVPGSGKSTWIKKNKAETDVVVSRDDIRFEMIKEGDDYFAYEDKVIETFLFNIRFHLQHGQTVYADATHLNKKARAKVINKVKEFANEIECVWIHPKLETAIERNARREGLARVPNGVIRRMWYQMDIPEVDEGFDKITVIKEKEE